MKQNHHMTVQDHPENEIFHKSVGKGKNRVNL